MSELPTLLGY